MNKLILGLTCLILAGCSPEEPNSGHRAENTKPAGTEIPGEVSDDDGETPTPAPRVDGFDWTDYSSDLIKVQFRIHNAAECGMQNATIYYGTDANSLLPATTNYYESGIIVATIKKPNAGIKRYWVYCEVQTKFMVFRTELFSVNF